MLSTLKHIIDTDGAANPSKASANYEMYRTIQQHAELGSPIDDSWITQEVRKDPQGLLSVEIVKNTYGSDAFLQSVTKGKMRMRPEDLLYVVTLEGMPYDSYEGDDVHSINSALAWLKNTVATLHQTYPAKYLVACSVFAKDFFEQNELYTLRDEYQRNSRGYRNALARTSSSPAEEQKLKDAVDGASDELSQQSAEVALKQYLHDTYIANHRTHIQLGVTEVATLLSK